MTLRLGACWLSATCSLVHAQAAAPSCPTQAQLRDQLEPLLDEPRELQRYLQSATVVDHGPSYSVVQGDVERDLDDPGRDCTERARLAAVLIVLKRPSAWPRISPRSRATCAAICGGSRHTRAAERYRALYRTP